MSTIKDEEKIVLYEELFKKIWDRVVISLGVITVTALVRRIIRKSSQRFPFLGALTVNNEGVNFLILKTKIRSEELENIKEGFEELIINLIDLLVELTGGLVVDKFFREDILQEVRRC